MEQRLLSQVEQINLSILCLIRDTTRASMADAITRFNLSMEELQLLCSLTPDAVLAIVRAAGNELLFQPRLNLCSMLQAPSTLLSILLSSQARSVSAAACAVM